MTHFFSFYQMANLMSILTVLMKSSRRLKQESPRRTAILRILWKGRENLFRVVLGWNAYRMLLQVHSSPRSKSRSRCQRGQSSPWRAAGKLTRLSSLPPHLHGTVAGFHISQNTCSPSKLCLPSPNFLLILFNNWSHIPREKNFFSKCRRNISIPFLRQASQQLFSKENKSPFKEEI